MCTVTEFQTFVFVLTTMQAFTDKDCKSEEQIEKIVEGYEFWVNHEWLEDGVLS